MDNNLTITFYLHTSSQKTRLQANPETPFSTICSKLFQKAKNTIDQAKNTIIFKLLDKQLDPESNNSIKSLGINNSSIIDVSWAPLTDKEKQIKKSRKRQNEMIKKSKAKIPEPENDPVKDTLIDMAMLGIEMKAKISQNLNEGKYFSIDEALEKKDTDKHFFALGLLARYLDCLGIKTAIEKEYGKSSQKNLDYANTLLQFLVNGMINYYKYCLSFKLTKEKIKSITDDPNEKKNFNEYFKELIISNFNIVNKENLIITSYTENLNIFFIIMDKKNDTIKINEDDLKQKFKYEEVSDLESFSYGPVLDAIILTKDMLDETGDKNGDKENYGQNEYRAGNKYYPPNGWYRCGVRVYNIYDGGNNDWLTWEEGKKGQWSICYHGITTKDDPNKYENEKDIKHRGNLVCKGVLCYQDPEDMESSSEEITIVNGEKYKVGFMLRVEPDHIREPESKKTFWFLNGTPEEIRPYGILMKKFDY